MPTVQFVDKDLASLDEQVAEHVDTLLRRGVDDWEQKYWRHTYEEEGETVNGFLCRVVW